MKRILVAMVLSLASSYLLAACPPGSNPVPGGHSMYPPAPPIPACPQGTFFSPTGGGCNLIVPLPQGMGPNPGLCPQLLGLNGPMPSNGVAPQIPPGPIVPGVMYCKYPLNPPIPTCHLGGYAIGGPGAPCLIPQS